MGENKKGQNALFLAVGVATLVVAIIGATFAYFSAAVNGAGEEIKGSTENNLAGALSLTVKRIVFENAGANSDYLVPTDLTVETDDETGEYDLTGINNAITKKCVGQGYTGCHIYRVTAKSTQALQNVSVRLTTLTTTAVDAASWKYAIYTNEGDEISVDPETKVETVVSTNYAADAIVATGDFASFKTTFADQNKTLDMHNNGSIEKDQPVYYYLVVYLANKAGIVQNPTGDGAEANEHNGTGTYNGTVSMDVLGGQVVASFSATA